MLPSPVKVAAPGRHEVHPGTMPVGSSGCPQGRQPGWLTEAEAQMSAPTKMESVSNLVGPGSLAEVELAEDVGIAMKNPVIGPGNPWNHKPF